MEGFFLEMGWMLAALFIGVCIGSLTGLIPGFHVNNVALILLGVSPALPAQLEYPFPPLLELL